jgi:hypothetical protein
MPFIGKSPTAGFATIVKDTLTSNGSTTQFTLSKQVASATDIAVFVGNVRQEPTTAYTVSGTTLDFGSGNAPAAGLDMYVLHIGGTQESSIIPADNTISTAKLADDSVTKSKIGTTELDLTTIKDSTGTNTAMTIDSSGRVSMPNVIAWRVKKTNGDAGSGLITFNTLEVNQGSAYSGTRMTAPVAGIYLVSFTARHNSQTATHCEFKKNGTAFLGFRSTSTGGTVGNVGINATAIVDLTVNDYVEVSVVTGTVEGDNTVEGAIFTGHFIG